MEKDEKVPTKKYKTLYPDSMLSHNKVLYRQTIKNLNSFLKDNFSKNSSLTYKFPIKKPHSSKIPRQSIKRKSSIIEESSIVNPEKTTIQKFNESVSKNYISYNYYNNTKGALKSPKYSRKIMKSRLKSRKSINNSINDSKTNYNFLSYDSRPISPKSNIFNSSLSLYKLSRKKRKKEKFMENNKNNNLKSFSFNKYMTYRKKNLSKNDSNIQSPSSTQYKSIIKKNSLKLEYDSLTFSNSENKINSRNRSSISMKNKSINKKKSRLKPKDSIGKKNRNLSDFRIAKEQRDFHQKLYLHNLLSQLNIFESSDAFQVNEAKIKKNLISPGLFQRDIFIKEIKRASKNNDFFFKKFPGQSEKLKNLNFKQQKRAQSPHQNIYDNKSKYLLNNIEKLYKKSNNSQNFIKNLDYRLRTNTLKRIMEFVIPVKSNIRDFDIQFKDETLNYQRNIGKFFIYKGSGIFSDHLSSILKGDKIVKQAIKFDNI
jgi:hypothetical protein